MKETQRVPTLTTYDYKATAADPWIAYDSTQNPYLYKEVFDTWTKNAGKDIYPLLKDACDKVLKQTYTKDKPEDAMDAAIGYVSSHTGSATLTVKPDPKTYRPGGTGHGGAGWAMDPSGTKQLVHKVTINKIEFNVYPAVYLFVDK